MGEEFDRMGDIAAPFVTGAIPPEFDDEDDEENPFYDEDDEDPDMEHPHGYWEAGDY